MRNALGAKTAGDGPSAVEPMRLAVLVPAFNAARELPGVLARLAAIHPVSDTWVVDDGSQDETASVAHAAGVHVVSHSVNRGKGAALRTGFSAAAEYAAVATLDADGQHAPEDLPRLVAALHDADIVVGARPPVKPMPPHRRLGNRLSALFLSRLSGTFMPDVQSGYRVHRREVLMALGFIPSGREGSGPAPPRFHDRRYGLESEILVAAARLGFRIVSVPIRSVYEGVPSHFHPQRELPRFLALYARLCLDARAWSRHRAQLARSGETPWTS